MSLDFDAPNGSRVSIYKGNYVQYGENYAIVNGEKIWCEYVAAGGRYVFSSVKDVVITYDLEYKTTTEASYPHPIISLAADSYGNLTAKTLCDPVCYVFVNGNYVSWEPCGQLYDLSFCTNYVGIIYGNKVKIFDINLSRPFIYEFSNNKQYVMFESVNGLCLQKKHKVVVIRTNI
jgi:hypothetical protein